MKGKYKYGWKVRAIKKAIHGNGQQIFRQTTLYAKQTTRYRNESNGSIIAQLKTKSHQRQLTSLFADRLLDIFSLSQTKLIKFYTPNQEAQNIPPGIAADIFTGLRRPLSSESSQGFGGYMITALTLAINHCGKYQFGPFYERTHTQH